MAFILRKIRPEDLELFYPAQLEKEWLEGTRRFKDSWDKFALDANVAINEEEKMYMYQLPMNSERHPWHYVFGCSEGYVLLEYDLTHLGWRYMAKYASESLRMKSNLIKPQIEAALRASGQYMQGSNDPERDNDIPNAEIVM